jgi:hypothetical protein
VDRTLLLPFEALAANFFATYMHTRWQSEIAATAAMQSIYLLSPPLLLSAVLLLCGIPIFRGMQ